MMKESIITRCAIYTRKSTDEGLDKEFNTLEAQREAGENYIKSQKHQGWELIEKQYNDGGYSGGNMNRPALQELLADIKDGKIDMIVVYKIDRLTRSLLDFSKMMEIFDEHNCSFVSVTQSFNTADSMGRLMLNVLLSFAQFEREISGERIRDKIKASKKKGMWMGGRIPYGYYSNNKKLEPEPTEADIVRQIFKMYLLHRSIAVVVKYMNDNNITFRGKTPTMLYVREILKKPVYIGKIVHKGNIYDGAHKGLVSVEVFKEVQELLKNQRQEKEKKFIPLCIKTNSESTGLLKDLLYCACCQSKMRIERTKMKTRVLWYYACPRIKKRGKISCTLPYIQTTLLDDLVLKIIAPLVKAPALMQELAHQTSATNKNFNEAEVFNAMQDVDILYSYMSVMQKRELIFKLINKIVIAPDKIHIVWTPTALSLMNGKQKKYLTDEPLDPESPETDYPIDFRKKRGKLEIYLPENTKEMLYISKKSAKNPDKILLKAVVDGFHYRQKIETNGWTVADLAKVECIDRAYLGCLIRLTYLAPDIIDAILRGTQPAYLTAQELIRADIPPIWADQRRLFGFPEI